MRRIKFILGSLLVLLSIDSLFASGIAMKKLSGHVPREVSKLSPKADLADTNRLRLALGLPLRNTNQLSQFLADLYQPGSAQYRHYLTPEEFTSQFGPTEDEYAALIAFARSNHFTVEQTHGNRVLLDVSANVADIQNAFHLRLHKYAHPTENRDFYAPDSEPTVDPSLALVDITGLDNYALPRPKNLHKDTRTDSATPRTGSGANGGYIGNDFRAAYVPGTTLTGAGQQIGLLEFDGFYASDITAYETSAGLAAVPLQTVLLDGYSGTPTTGSSSGDPEVSLDIEVAIAMAPGLSKIVIFEAGPSGSPNDILNAMAASNSIKSFSSSWGWSGGPSTTTDNIFKQMAAQGQSFFNASGDSDAFTTGASSANGVDNTSLDNAPSSSPYITQVGGTTLTTSGPGGSWVSETAWNWGLDSGSYVGTSGGISSYYPIPTWQAGISMSANGGSSTFRNIPDVALTADNVYVAHSNGSVSTFGGTSCAAPLWAAVAALMNQQAAAEGLSSVGFINPAIYALANGSSYNSFFHDVTTGNNVSSASPNAFYAVTGYDLCTGLGTPSGQAIINALTAPPDALVVIPATGFTSSGPVGGPFSVTSQTFVLTNTGSASLNWTATSSTNWLSASTTSGVLASHASVSVTFSLTSSAYSLGAGIFTANAVFSDVSSGASQTALVTLNVGQSIVQNGGFETGNFTGWTLVGDTVITGRRGSSTIYDAVENTSTVVHSGSYGAALGDDKVATLSQTLSTATGRVYLLSLWVNNSASGTTQQFQVNWNGNAIYSLSNPPAFGWTNLQFFVTASSTNSVLQFAVENDPSFFGLDDVSVTPITGTVLLPAVKSGNNINLTWNSTTGLIYQLQYKTNLAQVGWINLGSTITGTGSSITISDSNAVSSSTQRFYRLMVMP